MTVATVAFLTLAGVPACEGPGARPDGAGGAEGAGSQPPAVSPDSAAPGRRTDDSAGAASSAGDTVSAPAAPRSDVRGYDTVFVFFDGPSPEGRTIGPLVPLPRVVPDTDALSFALRELLEGPTTAERARPVYTFFSRETAGTLRWVTLEDGVAIVEVEDLRPIIPGASSSAGSTSLLRQLEATVFQFPEVRRVEFRIDGSCETFMEWLQIGCVSIPRSSFEEPDGYRRAIPSGADG